MSPIIRAVRPDEHDAVLDLWDAVFERVPREFYIQYFTKDPWQKDEYTQVCEVDGKLVSCVQLCRRPVESPFGTLLMGGIANVVTLVEHRGHGYNTALLKSCVAVMEREGFDFSVLFTGINDFYSRLGWVTVPCALFTGTLNPGAKAPTGAAKEIKRFPSAEELIKVYYAFNAGRQVACVRPPEYWDWVAGRYAACRWLGVRESGRLIGYAAFLAEQTRINIREICWLPDRPDAAGALAKGIVAQAIATKVTEVFAITPAEPALLDGLTAAGVEVTRGQYQSSMFRRIGMATKKFESLCNMMAEPNAIMWGADHF